MNVMVRFYQRGEAAKKTQYESVLAELQKIEIDIEMLEKQRHVLTQFPPFHPKRKEYEAQLDAEQGNILKAKKKITNYKPHNFGTSMFGVARLCKP